MCVYLLFDTSNTKKKKECIHFVIFTLMFYSILILLLVLSVSGLPPLRKHHSHIISAIDETDVIEPTHHNITLLFSTDTSICGLASLSCMAFSQPSSSIPVRCGILNKAPVCERYDSDTKQSKCDAFCDADG